MIENEKPRSSQKKGMSPIPAVELDLPQVNSQQQCMETTKVQANLQNPQDQQKPTARCFKIKKISLFVGLLLLLLLAGIGLAVYFGLMVSGRSQSTLVFNSEKSTSTSMASGATFSTRQGVLKNAGLEASIPFTFTSISLPAVRSPNGRLLQQGKTINSVDYFHKDTETCVSFDLNYKPELRTAIDSAVEYVLQNAPEIGLESLESLPDVLKSMLVSDNSLQGRLNGPVDFSVSYDGVYDTNTKKFKLLTEEEPYVKEQHVKIDPASESPLLKTTPIIKDVNNVKEVSAATASVVKEILSTVANVVEVYKATFDVEFKNAFRDEKEVKAASEAARKALGVLKGCCVVSHTILRCSKKVWESGELPVSNLKGSEPLEVPELIFKSQ